MTFDEVIEGISTITDLRRVAAAHVVDFRNLDEDELRQSLLKVKGQYCLPATVAEALHSTVALNADHPVRNVGPILLRDVLLNAVEYDLPFHETEEQVIAYEQQVLNESNELDLSDIAGNRPGGDRHRGFELYAFILEVVWETGDNASVEEISLLRRLRRRLNIGSYDALLLDARTGVFPKKGSDTHTRDEIGTIRRQLQSLGLLFVYRDKNGTDHDVIPDELATAMRDAFGLQVRRLGYEMLLSNKRVRTRAYLQTALEKRNVTSLRDDGSPVLQRRVLQYVPPTELLGGVSPRDGLSNEELQSWLAELGEAVSGSKSERIERIIAHYDNIRAPKDETVDPRALLLEYFEALACRDRDTLRAQHLVEKDNEMERRFEEATAFLFEALLNHTPLNQAGTNHPDGLLSFRGVYVMWDNKSKDAPATVNLRDHMPQFAAYMDDADKPVAMFLVIGPGFTPESEGEAIRYTGANLGRNIVLITAAELKSLAREWAEDANPRREEPFPLGLLARSGRFSRTALGPLVG